MGDTFGTLNRPRKMLSLGMGLRPRIWRWGRKGADGYDAININIWNQLHLGHFQTRVPVDCPAGVCGISGKIGMVISASTGTSALRCHPPKATLLEISGAYWLLADTTSRAERHAVFKSRRCLPFTSSCMILKVQWDFNFNVPELWACNGTANIQWHSLDTHGFSLNHERSGSHPSTVKLGYPLKFHDISKFYSYYMRVSFCNCLVIIPYIPTESSFSCLTHPPLVLLQGKGLPVNIRRLPKIEWG